MLFCSPYVFYYFPLQGRWGERWPGDFNEGDLQQLLLWLFQVADIGALFIGRLTEGEEKLPPFT